MSSPLNIAIVHYHFRRGGVARVVQTTLEAFDGSDIRFAILSAEPPADTDAYPCPVGLVDGLGYDSPAPQRPPAELADRLRRAARDALGADPDVWHVHNHSLGKNASLPEALRRLAAEGGRILLHLHDFPEDGRPANYRHLRDHLGDIHRDLYPAAAQIHYAGLTDRDVSFLREAGSPAGRTHLLANPVARPGTADAPPRTPRLFLYPTRAIRRKNLGEFLLWAALAEPGDRYAVTLAPENPLERPAYDAWVRAATQWNLPVEFELGSRSTLPFPELVQSASALVTTSIAEGFGLAFLEPWLLHRPVAGRNLPEITAGFADNGIPLDALYDRLEVPLDWIGRERLRARIASALADAHDAYGREAGDEAIERAVSAAAPGDTVDFGRLDEAMQREVIAQLVANPDDRIRIAPDRLRIAEETRTPREAILNAYRPEDYARRLRTIYHTLANAPIEPVGALSASTLLDTFLDPARFCLLRS